MIAMSMGNNGRINLFPRINVEIAKSAIETFVRKRQKFHRSILDN
jgi:hypothetical protein